MRILAALLLLVPVLAGCTQPGPVPDEPALFDGGAALRWVDALVNTDDGLRPRHPTAPGHADTADWLQAAMEVPGWTVERQDFTGTDYQALDKGAAGRWADTCTWYDPTDAEEVPGLRFHNLLATYPSSDPDAPTLLLSAHWDAKENASDDPASPVPAANDGASGVGLLLQLQRHVAEEGLSFPFTLTVAFWDGEDGFEDCHPLAGSLYYARTMESGSIDRVLLLDMVGDPEARFIKDSTSTETDPGLVDLLWARAPDHGLADNFPDAQRSITDDHIPFAEQGVPSVDLIDAGRGFPPYWHTTGDTVDKLSADMLGRVGDLLLDVLQDPGFITTWPASKQ